MIYSTLLTLSFLINSSQITATLYFLSKENMERLVVPFNSDFMARVPLPLPGLGKNLRFSQKTW